MQILVLMVPVFLGLIGFAVDLGRLYSARAELQTAAHAMASAAAGRLIGTDVSTADATDEMRRLVETGTGYGNKYDFGGTPIGESSGTLVSEIVEPTYYATSAEASEEGTAPDNAAGEVSGSLARHVRVELTGETPLVFWRFLSLAQEGKVAIRARAAAGVSAPVCTACATVPIAIAPIDAEDPVNYGFVTDTRYTFGYSCTGNPIPQPLTGDATRIQYVLLNRLNETLTTFSDDSQQLYRSGAQGLVPSTTNALSCMTIGVDESIWASAGTVACNTNRVQPAVTSFLCGLATRLDYSNVQGCTSDAIADVDTLSALYLPDSDLTEVANYASYIGNQRRIITVAIVDTVNPTGTMLVQGFRQFLVQPLVNQTGIGTNDSNGRFSAVYIGAPVPLKQGLAGSCGVTSGPGKVVLYR
ncbi:MAG: Tad domain-containing protein [Acidobacteria bacterium]|nr:Tad domain-containing protein [Acidobacteriota bacterium]